MRFLNQLMHFFDLLVIRKLESSTDLLTSWLKKTFKDFFKYSNNGPIFPIASNILVCIYLIFVSGMSGIVEARTFSLVWPFMVMCVKFVLYTLACMYALDAVSFLLGAWVESLGDDTIDSDYRGNFSNLSNVFMSYNHSIRKMAYYILTIGKVCLFLTQTFFSVCLGLNVSALVVMGLYTGLLMILCSYDYYRLMTNKDALTSFEKELIDKTLISSILYSPYSLKKDEQRRPLILNSGKTFTEYELERVRQTSSTCPTTRKQITVQVPNKPVEDILKMMKKGPVTKEDLLKRFGREGDCWFNYVDKRFYIGEKQGENTIKNFLLQGVVDFVRA